MITPNEGDECEELLKKLHDERAIVILRNRQIMALESVLLNQGFTELQIANLSRFDDDVMEVK